MDLNIFGYTFEPATNPHAQPDSDPAIHALVRVCDLPVDRIRLSADRAAKNFDRLLHHGLVVRCVGGYRELDFGGRAAALCLAGIGLLNHDCGRGHGFHYLPGVFVHASSAEDEIDAHGRELAERFARQSIHRIGEQVLQHTQRREHSGGSRLLLVLLRRDAGDGRGLYFLRPHVSGANVYPTRTAGGSGVRIHSYNAFAYYCCLD